MLVDRLPLGHLRLDRAQVGANARRIVQVQIAVIAGDRDGEGVREETSEADHEGHVQRLSGVKADGRGRAPRQGPERRAVFE